MQKKAPVDSQLEDIDDEIKELKSSENVFILTGELHAVQEYICEALEMISEYDKNFDESTLKMLIPNIFVNKLIGANGSMIKEIAAKSSGAQIKILSDKEKERKIKDCVVTVNGSLKNKQKATK